jgi:hypothetical protein
MAEPIPEPTAPKPEKSMHLNFADACFTGSHMGIRQWI